MIRTFNHKGIAKFFETGSKAGIQPKHAGRLENQLDALNNVVNPKTCPPVGTGVRQIGGLAGSEWYQ
jgi:toxin HigB-1